jgi:hypothetical protein
MSITQASEIPSTSVLQGTGCRITFNVNDSNPLFPSESASEDECMSNRDSNKGEKPSGNSPFMIMQKRELVAVRADMNCQYDRQSQLYTTLLFMPVL